MYILFFISLVLILLALPIWPYSKNWGYRISVIFAILAVIFLYFMVRSITYVEYEKENNGYELEIEKKHN